MATRAASRLAAEQHTPKYTRLHERWMAADPEYVAESLALDAAETISRIMGAQGLTKAELARRMKVSRAYVTRMLQAPPNMTLKTLATVALALGLQPKVLFEMRNHRLDTGRGHPRPQR